MDDEQPQTGSSGSLSIVRAAAVLILFVVAVAVLVSVGTRPSVSSTPTTTRRAPIGTWVRAVPSSPTVAARTTAAAPAPESEADQLRVNPIASTIVRASTASTAQARKTEMTSPISVPLMPWNVASVLRPPRMR